MGNEKSTQPLYKTMLDLQKFCTYCGSAWTGQFCWPRKCDYCNSMTFQNPKPVVIGLIPVFSPHHARPGLLLVRRIRSQKWAPPGGYMELHDMGGSLDWRSELSREVKEEAGFSLSPQGWKVFDVKSSVESGTVLIFAEYKSQLPIEMIPQKPVHTPNYIRDPETDGLNVVFAGNGADFEFSLHEEVVNAYLNRA